MRMENRFLTYILIQYIHVSFQHMKGSNQLSTTTEGGKQKSIHGRKFPFIHSLNFLSVTFNLSASNRKTKFKSTTEKKHQLLQPPFNMEISNEYRQIH